jgi:hypothetical protein
LAADPTHVGEIMLKPENVQKLTEVFGSCNQLTFGQMVPPFLSICSSYPSIGVALVNSNQFFVRLIDRLQNKKQDALVRVNLLKLLSSLYENHPDKKRLLRTFDLTTVVSQLKGERSVVIQELASKLLQLFRQSK